jgi:hypothetical protein
MSANHQQGLQLAYYAPQPCSMSIVSDRILSLAKTKVVLVPLQNSYLHHAKTDSFTISLWPLRNRLMQCTSHIFSHSQASGVLHSESDPDMHNCSLQRVF